MRRLLLLCSFAVIVPVLAACAPPPPLPTVAVLPTDIPATATVTPNYTPTPTLTPAPTATSTPVPTAAPDAVIFNALLAKFGSRRVTFLAYMTPQTLRMDDLKLIYRFPDSDKTDIWDAPVPRHNVGEITAQPAQYSMSVDAMPPGEDKIVYRWRVTLENGAWLDSPEQTFKITEAISEERRDHLPILEATVSFESQFPTKATMAASFIHTTRITNARIAYTQNQGLELEEFNVRVPSHQAGDSVTLSFDFTDQLGLQIPWQQMEWWFVLTDQQGKQWRTQPVSSVYSDTRFHKWLETKTERAMLYTYDQSKANVAALAKASDESIARLEEAFGYKLLYTPHIVVYNSQKDFESWAPPQITERFIGMASGSWGGAVVTYWDSIAFTGYAIIQHELVHLFQFQSIRDERYQVPPRWWIEGSATYFETVVPDDFEATIRALYRQYPPPNLEFGVPPVAPDASGIPYPYYAGMTFTRFLIDRYGIEAFRLVHINLARHMKFLDAIEAATGKTLKELSDEWEVWITE